MALTQKSRMFNGSTLTFNGVAVAKLADCQHKVSGAIIDVTEPGDVMKFYEVGVPDHEVTAKLAGGTTLAHGATGTLAIVWNNGLTTATPGLWVVTNGDNGGSQDAPITGNATFKPTPSEGSA